jgi:hypothetical protein
MVLSENAPISLSHLIPLLRKVLVALSEISHGCIESFGLALLQILVNSTEEAFTEE